MRRRLEVARRVGQHRPPLRRRRILRAEAEEAEAGDVDDRRRQRERPLHDHRRDRVREDVRDEDRPPRTPTERAARTKSFSRSPRIEPRSRRAKIGICVTPDRDHDLDEARAEHRDDPDREQQAGDREHDVHQAHDDGVDPAADVAGDRAEHEPDREADGDRDDADQQRVAGAVDDARELVAARAGRRRTSGRATGPGSSRLGAGRGPGHAGPYGAISGAKSATSDEDRRRGRSRRSPPGCGAAGARPRSRARSARSSWISRASASATDIRTPGSAG